MFQQRGELNSQTTINYYYTGIDQKKMVCTDNQRNVMDILEVISFHHGSTVKGVEPQKCLSLKEIRDFFRCPTWTTISQIFYL